MEGKSPNYLKCIYLRLNKYILPEFASTPIKDITSVEILSLCRRIEISGYCETAIRVKVLIGQIFRFAIAAGYADSDPTVALSGALRVKKVKHYATITEPKEIAILLIIPLSFFKQ